MSEYGRLNRDKAKQDLIREVCDRLSLVYDPAIENFVVSAMLDKLIEALAHEPYLLYEFLGMVTSLQRRTSGE